MSRYVGSSIILSMCYSFWGDLPEWSTQIDEVFTQLRDSREGVAAITIFPMLYITWSQLFNYFGLL